jgi:hypothetical protein
MELLDFLAVLPAEETDFFVSLLEAGVPTHIAVQETMKILAESEPTLARRLEGPVQDWLKISKPMVNDPGLARKTGKPGKVSFEPESSI